MRPPVMRAGGVAAVLTVALVALSCGRLGGRPAVTCKNEMCVAVVDGGCLVSTPSVCCNGRNGCGGHSDPGAPVFTLVDGSDAGNWAGCTPAETERGGCL